MTSLLKLLMGGAGGTYLTHIDGDGRSLGLSAHLLSSFLFFFNPSKREQDTGSIHGERRPSSVSNALERMKETLINHN